MDEKKEKNSLEELEKELKFKDKLLKYKSNLVERPVKKDRRLK